MKVRGTRGSRYFAKNHPLCDIASTPHRFRLNAEIGYRDHTVAVLELVVRPFLAPKGAKGSTHNGMPSCHRASHRGTAAFQPVVTLIHEEPTEHVDVNDMERLVHREQWWLLQCLPQVDNVKRACAELIGVDGDIWRNAEEETIAGAAQGDVGEALLLICRGG